MKFIEKDTPGQRIADLCKDYGISQKELAEKIGLSAPQLSRIISGKTSTINSDALIGIAETFKVSTDYILGLSSVSVRKSYDISQLGLSENAIKGLITGTIDVEILNRLLENPNPNMNAEMFQSILASATENPPATLDDVLSLVTSKMSMVMEVDDKTKEQFNALFTQIAEQFKEQN